MNYSNRNLDRICKELATKLQYGKTNASSVFKDGRALSKESSLNEGKYCPSGMGNIVPQSLTYLGQCYRKRS